MQSQRVRIVPDQPIFGSVVFPLPGVEHIHPHVGTYPEPSFVIGCDSVNLIGMEPILSVKVSHSKLSAIDARHAESVAIADPERTLRLGNDSEIGRLEAILRGDHAPLASVEPGQSPR